MTTRLDAWEQWKAQAATPKHTEVELVGIPGHLRERKHWAHSVSAITKHIAYHLKFREGEAHCVTVQGKENQSES